VNASDQERERPQILIPHQWKSARGLYGADRVLVRILREIAPIARPVVVVESEGELPDAARRLGGDVEVREMGVLRRSQMNPAGMARSAFHIASASLWMAREIRRRNIRLVVTSTVSVLPGALAARMTRRPHLWLVHEILRGPWAMLSIPVSALSTRIVAVSEASARSVHRGRQGVARRTVVAYPGVELPPAEPADGGAFRREHGTPERPLLIGLAGRLHYWKGQDYFLRALHEVRKKNIGGFRALIIGDPYRDYPQAPEHLRQRARDLGLEKDVVFCGHRDDMQSVYRGLDIAVAPSVFPEPFGLVVAEAMAAGLPVIATDWGGPREMIENGMSGYLIPPDDPGVFAARLEQLIRDPELRRAMGKSARQRIASAFPASAFDARMRREICELIKQGGQ
jgi:glycosyltransferase involved in cell wall biosynthesis